MLILICEDEKSKHFWTSVKGYHMDFLFHLITFKLLMHNQNPENYAVRKGISKDHIEKHIQGNFLYVLVELF